MTTRTPHDHHHPHENVNDDDEDDDDDDWGLPCDFALFARHEARDVWLGGDHDDGSRRMMMRIYCVESLTPLDMVQLGDGVHDATGHCVWTACFLWLAALPTILHQDGWRNTVDDTTSSPSSSCSSSSNTFRAVELGSGTGLGGLALSHHLSRLRRCCHVTLTDADPAALDLCRRNVELNRNDDDDDVVTAVRPLTWTTIDHDDTTSSSSPLPDDLIGTADTVLAADVIYDIRQVPAIAQTAAALLRDDDDDTTSTGSRRRWFYLAHVPRACFTGDVTADTVLGRRGDDDDDDDSHAAASSLTLEDYIVQQVTTTTTVLRLVRIVRPLDLVTSWSEPPPELDVINDTSLQEMQDVGAALLVFEKTKRTTTS